MSGFVELPKKRTQHQHQQKEEEDLEFVYEITESELRDVRMLLTEAHDLLRKLRSEDAKEARMLIKDALVALEEIDEEMDEQEKSDSE